jgi:hypothetical protein
VSAHTFIITGALWMSDNVIPVAAPLTQKEEKRIFAKQKQYSFKRNNLVGYLFIAPWLIGFIAFSLIPIGASLVLEFYWLR